MTKATETNETKKATLTDEQILNTLKSESNTKSEVLLKIVRVLRSAKGKAFRPSEIEVMLNDGKTTAKKIRNTLQDLNCKGNTPRILRNDKISALTEKETFQYFKNGKVFYGIADNGTKIAR